MERALKQLFLGIFAIAAAATFLVFYLPSHSHPSTVRTFAASHARVIASSENHAERNSETRIRVLLAPTVVRLKTPPTSLGASTAPPQLAQPHAAEQLEQDFVSSIVLPSASATSAPDSPQQLLPDRAMAEIAPTPVSVPSKAHSSTDAQQVIAVLNRYSQAWSEMDMADIRALRPSLERRTLKQALAGARSISMEIHPTRAPKIEGDRATVECIHHVAQVFEDGTERQSPDVPMTYVLVKRGPSWLIADSR